jgi:uncharacterized protein
LKGIQRKKISRRQFLFFSVEGRTFHWKKLFSKLLFCKNRKGEDIVTLAERISSELKEAIKNRDSLRLDTLRMLKSKILAVNARANLPDPEVIKLFKTYFGNLEEAKEQATMANRPEIVARLEGEMRIVQEFLPKMLSLEETKKIVLQAIQDSGAKTKKELGLVMKSIMKLNQPIDAKLAKELASQFLAD